MAQQITACCLSHGGCLAAAAQLPLYVSHATLVKFPFLHVKLSLITLCLLRGQSLYRPGTLRSGGAGVMANVWRNLLKTKLLLIFLYSGLSPQMITFNTWFFARS